MTFKRLLFILGFVLALYPTKAALAADVNCEIINTCPATLSVVQGDTIVIDCQGNTANQGASNFISGGISSYYVKTFPGNTITYVLQNDIPVGEYTLWATCNGGNSRNWPITITEYVAPEVLGASTIPIPSITELISSTTPEAASTFGATKNVAFLVLGVIISVLLVGFIISVFGKASKSVLKRGR